MIRIAIAGAVLLACASPGPAAQRGDARAQAEFERALAGKTPGKPVNCVEHNQVTEVRPLAGKLLFLQGRRMLWVNAARAGCRGLEYGDLIVTHSTMGEYCAGDIVETRAPVGGAITGSCTLGQFVPYTR